MGKLWLKQAGTWVTPKKLYLKIGATWQAPKAMWIRVAGVWRQIAFLQPSNHNYNVLLTSVNTTSLSIIWQPTGDVTRLGNSLVGWLTDIDTGNGDTFHMKWVQTAGNTSVNMANAMNTWQPMTVGYAMSITCPVNNVRNANGYYYVSSDGGATVAGQGTWSLELDRT